MLSKPAQWSCQEVLWNHRVWVTTSAELGVPQCPPRLLSDTHHLVLGWNVSPLGIHVLPLQLHSVISEVWAATGRKLPLERRLRPGVQLLRQEGSQDKSFSCLCPWSVTTLADVFILHIILQRLFILQSSSQGSSGRWQKLQTMISHCASAVATCSAGKWLISSFYLPGCWKCWKLVGFTDHWAWQEAWLCWLSKSWVCWISVSSVILLCCYYWPVGS